MIQNLFLELWEKQPPIDSVQQWNAYLKKSLLRKIIKELKRRNQTSHNLDAGLTVLSQPSYEELLIAFQTETDRKARVQVALQDLPLVEKEMLEARFKNGKSYEEIAAQSGKSKQTVYNQIYSAIKKLRKALLCSFF